MLLSNGGIQNITIRLPNLKVFFFFKINSFRILQMGSHLTFNFESHFYLSNLKKNNFQILFKNKFLLCSLKVKKDFWIKQTINWKKKLCSVERKLWRCRRKCPSYIEVMWDKTLVLNPTHHHFILNNYTNLASLHIHFNK